LPGRQGKGPQAERDRNLTTDTPKATIKGIFHTFLAVMTWLLFLYWWNQVIPKISVEDASVAFLVIFLTLLITSVLTLLWVRHNLGIFRRKGPRKGLPAVSEEILSDSLGRTLDLPGYDSLKSAPVVFISREDDRKRFDLPGKPSREPG
jgi:hypothetical protein